MKDNFSKQSETYSKFRPTYPSEFINGITSIVREKHLAWDCGTGNGQVAAMLSSPFKKVIATDISENQLSHAPKKSLIEYRLEPAESTSLDSNSVDLITVAQAIHWFNFDAFFEEANRVMKTNGVIAIFGYALFKTVPKIDTLISHLYSDVLDSYWDPERKYIEDEYSSVPFPFKEIDREDAYMKFHWTFDQMIGYLKSWSAVQHYIDAVQIDPVDSIRDELRQLWPESTTIPISTKIIQKVGIKH